MVDLPVERRRAVRLVVLDRDDHVLLLHIREPLHPESGSVWELPGGGIDAGETHVDAALRELTEETGLVADAAAVGPANWRRSVTFKHAGARRLQHEMVVAVRLDEVAPTVETTQQLPDELETFLGARWWTVAEVEASSDRFFPGSLPDYLRRFLGGEKIHEPFEHFS
jgi:8-oxo-dGTP pyrophosphatase MutT (NUDIX family)